MDDAPGSVSLPQDPVLREKLDALIRDGEAIWHRFDRDVRRERWHPFVAADYRRVRQGLRALPAPGLRFLEWGSASGIITIMADLLGFEAYGIELDPELVDVARELAGRYDSQARFAAGSFFPAGYVWQPESGDARPGTLGHGEPAYARLGRSLADFDVVFAYPWTGEEPLLQDVMRRHGHPAARLLLYGLATGVRVIQNGGSGEEGHSRRSG